MSSNYPLSPFQSEKLEYYLRFLVGPSDGPLMLTAESMERLNERILAFTGWDRNSREAKECKEVHDTFFEILLGRVKEMEEDFEPTCISLSLWLDIWSSMLQGVMGMPNLPIYVRLLPKVLFKVIDRQANSELNAIDLAIFYRDIVHLETAEETAQKAFEQMTDGGRYRLDAQGYEQLFANFLIGRTPYGPGRYIFGCFEHEVLPFQLIKPLPEPGNDATVHPIKRSFQRRPSKTLIKF